MTHWGSHVSRAFETDHSLEVKTCRSDETFAGGSNSNLAIIVVFLMYYRWSERKFGFTENSYQLLIWECAWGIHKPQRVSVASNTIPYSVESLSILKTQLQSCTTANGGNCMLHKSIIFAGFCSISKRIFNIPRINDSVSFNVCFLCIETIENGKSYRIKT